MSSKKNSAILSRTETGSWRRKLFLGGNSEGGGGGNGRGGGGVNLPLRLLRFDGRCSLMLSCSIVVGLYKERLRVKCEGDFYICPLREKQPLSSHVTTRIFT